MTLIMRKKVEFTLDEDEVIEAYDELGEDAQQMVKNHVADSDTKVTEDSVVAFIQDGCRDTDLCKRYIDAMSPDEDDLLYAIKMHAHSGMGSLEKLFKTVFKSSSDDDDDDTQEDCTKEQCLCFIEDNCGDTDFLNDCFDRMSLSNEDCINLVENHFEDDAKLRVAIMDRYDLKDLDEEVDSPSSCKDIPAGSMPPCVSEIDSRYDKVFSEMRHKFTLEQLQAILQIQI